MEFNSLLQARINAVESTLTDARSSDVSVDHIETHLNDDCVVLSIKMDAPALVPELATNFEDISVDEFKIKISFNDESRFVDTKLPDC